MRKALDELFSGKCAYCENPIGSTQPTDVERFLSSMNLEKTWNVPVALKSSDRKSRLSMN